MLNYFKWMSSLALVSLFTVGDLPGLFPQIAAQAQTSATAPTVKKTPANRVALNLRGGQINVVYEATSDPFSANLIKAYQRYGLFEKIGNLITSEIDLPDLYLIWEKSRAIQRFSEKTRLLRATITSLQARVNIDCFCLATVATALLETLME